MTFRMMDPPKSQVCSGTRIPATPLWGRPSQPPVNDRPQKIPVTQIDMDSSMNQYCQVHFRSTEFRNLRGHLGMDQYLLIPFLGE